METRIIVIIQAFYRTKETKETSTVFEDVKSEWLPPSYWIAHPLSPTEITALSKA